MEKKQILNTKLTKRDMDVMNVLWDAECPKTAAMIVKEEPDLAMNTVQAVLRKLLKNDLIEVADIVYSGTVLSRCYVPTISQESFMLQKITDDYQALSNKVSKVSILSALIEAEKDPEIIKQDMEQLREYLDNYTKKQKK